MVTQRLPLLNDDYPRIVSVNHLARILGYDIDLIRTVAETAGDFYKPFDQFKKLDEDGRERWRHIDNPTGVLKDIQRKIQTRILDPIAYRLPDYLSGGMPERSTVKNALPHVSKEIVLEMDLEKCYDNISEDQIRRVWIQLGCGREVANILTMLTTTGNRLPQGSPASTILCNLVLAEMANELHRNAQRRGMSYTQYIDDATISGKAEVVRLYMKEAIGVVQRHGAKLNKSKTELIPRSRGQTVTGVGVNQKLAITNRKFQSIRERIVTISHPEGPINKKIIQSIWGQIHNAEQIDRKKGKKLASLARTRLDSLEIFDGPKIKKSPRTRECSSYNQAH